MFDNYLRSRAPSVNDATEINTIQKTCRKAKLLGMCIFLFFIYWFSSVQCEIAALVFYKQTFNKYSIKHDLLKKKASSQKYNILKLYFIH